MDQRRDATVGGGSENSNMSPSGKAETVEVPTWLVKQAIMALRIGRPRATPVIEALQSLLPARSRVRSRWSSARENARG